MFRWTCAAENICAYAVSEQHSALFAKAQSISAFKKKKKKYFIEVFQSPIFQGSVYETLNTVKSPDL